MILDYINCWKKQMLLGNYGEITDLEYIYDVIESIKNTFL